MCFKSKHQEQLYERIQKNFTEGKDISRERHKLAFLNENMRFKGGPKDKNYEKQIKFELQYEKQLQRIKEREKQKLESSMASPSAKSKSPNKTFREELSKKSQSLMDKQRRKYIENLKKLKMADNDNDS